MPEVLQPVIIESSFEVSPRIDSGRSMALKVDEISGLLLTIGRVLCMKEVVETHFQQSCQRGIRRDVPTDAGVLLILAVHHRHRVPADQALNLPLHRSVAGIGQLIMLRNRIVVRRGQLAGRRHAGLARTLPQGFQ